MGFNWAFKGLKGQEFKHFEFLTPSDGTDMMTPETSVRNYHYSLRNNPEERGSHILRGGSLKSRLQF